MSVSFENNHLMGVQADQSTARFLDHFGQTGNVRFAMVCPNIPLLDTDAAILLETNLETNQLFSHIGQPLLYL